MALRAVSLITETVRVTINAVSVTINVPVVALALVQGLAIRHADVADTVSAARVAVCAAV